MRQYSLPSTRVHRLFLSACVAGVLIAGAAVFFAVDTTARLRASLLARENQLLKVEMVNVENRVANLDRAVANLAERDGRIRSLAGLIGIDEEVLDVGIGGPGLDSPSDSELWRLDPEASEAAYAIHYDLAFLMRRAELLDRSFGESEASLADQHERLEVTPSISPVYGVLTSAYSHERENPITGEVQPHRALDIAAAWGTSFVATGPGRVVSSGRRDGLGFAIEIDHGFGLRTRYGHASKLLKRVGQLVQRGEVIGLVGSSGSSSGPHVHYEVRLNGRQVNPFDYILWPAKR